MGINNIQFPKGSRFLVTGSAGFIGTNIVEALINQGYFVRGLDNFSTGKKSNVNKFENYSNFEFIEGDIRDFETCLKACDEINYVLHQAALGSVPRSLKEPLIYEDNNIKGTANMMEAAKIKGVKRFVYASSSSVYGSSNILPKVEGAEGDVLSPYALTKMINEKYGELYTSLFKLECIGLRYFNVFGRGQDPESQYAAVIPKFVKSILQNGEIVIYGDGEQSRDFTYIDNVIEANLKSCLAPNIACGKAYNIAFGKNYSVNQMLNLMCEKFKINVNPIHLGPREGDVKHSLGDISKAKQLLNYNPEWDFESGFSEALDWYKKNI